MPLASSCFEVEQLTAYLYQQLPAAQGDELEWHLDRCAACRALLAEASRALALTLEPSQARASEEPQGLEATGPEGTAPPCSSAELAPPVNPALAAGVMSCALSERYQIEGLIGLGGMGVVYRAWDRLLDRKVALKLVRPADGDSAAQEGSPAEAARLLREARAMARLRHPNLITIYDVGELNGQVFLAMELVEGETLRSFVRGRSAVAVLQAYLGAGAGLAAAHEAGVVHGDFKPDNVLCSGARVVVTDFGLARRIGEPAGAEGPGGTPTYMAPELWCGAAPSPSSDQYAFCVALRDALATARGPGSGVYEALMHRLGPLLERGLHPAAAQRFSSMQALCEALRRCLPVPVVSRWSQRLLLLPLLALLPQAGERRRNEGLCIDRIWTQAQRSAIERRVRALDSGGAEALLPPLLRGMDGYAARWRAACERVGEEPAPAIALGERRLRCLRERAEQAQQLRDRLLVADGPLLGRAEALLGQLPDPADCLEQRREPADLEGRRDTARQRLFTLDLQLTSGRSQGGIAEARALLAEVEALADPRLLAQALRTLAVLLAEGGGRQEAEALLRRSVAVAAAAFDGDQQGLSLSYLARVIAEDGARLEEAWRLVLQAEQFAEQRGQGSGHGKLLADAAIVASKLGRLDEAAERLRRALAWAEGRGDPLEVATLLNLLANTRLEQGRPAEAIPLLQRALALRTRVLGPAHTRVAGALSSLGRAYALLGCGEDAVALGEQALALREAALGPTHWSLAQTLLNLGEAYGAAGRAAEALQVTRRALALREQAGDAYLVVEAQLALGARLRAAGARAAAQRSFAQALRRAQLVLPAGHPLRQRAEREGTARPGALPRSGAALCPSRPRMLAAPSADPKQGRL